MKRDVLLFLAVVIISLCISGTASADLVNGSFENVNNTYVDHYSPNNCMALGYAPTGSITNALTGWTITNDIDWDRNVCYSRLTAQDGSYFIDLTGHNDSTRNGAVSQTIDTVIGHSYTLSFYLGTYQSYSYYRGPVTATATAGGTIQNFTFSPTGTNMQWGQFSMDFTASSSATNISITGVSVPTSGQFLGLDNVSVKDNTPAVPIPGAVWLLGTGLLGLIGVRRNVRG